MRVCHVTNTLRVDGTGITNVVVDLAAATADAGHRVRVLCSTSDEATTALLARHRVEVLQGYDTSTPRRFVAAALRARRALRDADIVHVHTVRATALASAARPLRFLRRSVATLHNPYQRSVPVMWATRAVVSISRADADHVRRRSHGLRSPAVVLNGLIGTPRLPRAAEVPAVVLPGRAVVYVGALYRRKGVDVLVRAMATVLPQVPEAHLYVVGNRDAPEVETLAHDLGLDDAVTFLGFQQEPRSFMRSAEVFVLPSRAEGFGNVLTEARSVGVPIVASRVGGIPEALDGGGAGVLVDPDEPDQLGRALIAVLTDADHAADLRRRSAAHLEPGRALIAVLTDADHAADLRRRSAAHLEPFLLATAAREYVAVYRRVLGRRST